MRKLIAIALCMLLLLCTVACNEDTDTDAATTPAATTEAATTTEASTTTAPQGDVQVGTNNWTKLY